MQPSLLSMGSEWGPGYFQDSLTAILLKTSQTIRKQDGCVYFRFRTMGLFNGILEYGSGNYIDRCMQVKETMATMQR